MSKTCIEEAIASSLECYFKDLSGVEPSNLYETTLLVVEKSLLELVLKRANNNQSRAAKWLGINRNTLRKKLAEHSLAN